MRTLSVMNLKGGVGKTISAVNIAYLLAAGHERRVLLIDNDKQGNASKFFGRHSYDAPSVADVLTLGIDIVSAIKPTDFERLDLLPANMSLLRANSTLLIDTSRSRDFRLKKALASVAGQYDWCVIDNAPDINISVINALMAADDVMVPVKIDRFAFDGLQELVEQIDDVRESNERLRLVGCFFTMFQRNNVSCQGEEWLRAERDYPVFDTRIRSTVKAVETTYCGKPLPLYSKNSTAAKDYENLVAEYLERIGGNQHE